jgi:hypothetical protein
VHQWDFQKNAWTQGLEFAGSEVLAAHWSGLLVVAVPVFNGCEFSPAS